MIRKSRPRCATGTAIQIAIAITSACSLMPSAMAAESWAERSARLNSNEISEQAAKEQGQRGDQDRRNKLSLRRIQPAMPGVDWNTDPTAIPYMLYQVNKRTDLPVHIDNDGLDVSKDSLFEHTVIYLTSHTRWGFNERETANLTRFLERGGTLFLDDCYNRGSAFTDSVRPEVAKMILGAEGRILAEDDPAVAECFRMVYSAPWPGTADFQNRPWQYFMLDGRPAVFFSPNDDGCGWEISTPPSASNPIGEGIGHGGDNRAREIFYQWATDWMLFTYTH